MPLSRKFWKKLVVLAVAVFATLLGNSGFAFSRSLSDDKQNDIASRLERVRNNLESQNSESELQPSKRNLSETSDQKIAQWNNWGNGWGNWGNGWGNWGNY